MTKRSLKANADWHFKVYIQVKSVVLTDHPEAPVYSTWEDYLADVYSYDAWTESPSEWEADNYGEKPTVPLTVERRRELKALGFEFKRDGSVLFNGVPAEEWVTSHGGKMQ